MGFLLKIVLFGLVFYYLIKTVGTFVYKLFGGQTVSGHRQHAQPKRREGEINIDSNPASMRNRNAQESSEGDYIDYEEVK